MSLEVIEIMIKESLRDGEISSTEKEEIVKTGESFGISKETILKMIDDEVNKYKKKVLNEEKQKKEEEIRKEREKEHKRSQEKKIALEEKKKEKEYQFREWSDYFDGTSFFTWGLLYGGIGILIGILNAYTHAKGWGAYIGMSFLGLFFGLCAYGIAVGLSFMTKRKPLLDWNKPMLIAYSIIVLAFICYLVIPF